MSKHKIILTGGGTGGHIYPLLRLAEKLKNDYELIYIGSNLDFEKEEVAKEKIKHIAIPCGKFRRNFSLLNLLLNIIDFFKVIFGIIKSLALLILIKPDLVFSKGGYVALPVCFAARLLSIKIIIHESDITLGLTNRITARFADRILVAFPLDAYNLKYASRSIHVGIPLRKEFFDFDNKRNDYVLFVGGSSGAVKINELVYEIAPKLLKEEKIVHLTGKNNFAQAQEFKKSLDENLARNYEPIDYSSHMEELIAKAKVVVTRSGATAIFEAAIFEKPLILVPISGDVAAHQSENAKYLKSINCGEIFDQTKPASDLLHLIKSVKESRNSKISELVIKKSAEKIKEIIDDEIADDLAKIKKVHFIGAGGVSMKLISRILTSLDKQVTSSDLKTGGHKKEFITKDLDLVVYSSAAGANSAAAPEHEQAKKFGIKTIKRSKMIDILAQTKSVIAVSGMHGKTTISSLIARAMENAGLGPSYLIGADYTMKNPTANYTKKSEYFVVESCEYDGSFLDISPEIALIANIEREHLDYFKGGLLDIIDQFGKFVENIKPGGILVYCRDDENIVKVIRQAASTLNEKSVKLVSYGVSHDSDFILTRVDFIDGQNRFKIKHINYEQEFTSPVPGEHFALNCCGAYALLKTFAISDSQIITTFANFYGADRRFSFVGNIANSKVYDDYAHHPTEIAATLTALREAFPQEEKIVIFEPHQQKRFDDFYAQFVDVFSQSKIDHLVLLPVFKIAGRDTDEVRNCLKLKNDLLKSGLDVMYATNYQEAAAEIEKLIEQKSVILTMGATNVNRVGTILLKNKKR